MIKNIKSERGWNKEGITPSVSRTMEKPDQENINFKLLIIPLICRKLL
jgi:hypothetical protein